MEDGQRILGVDCWQAGVQVGHPSGLVDLVEAFVEGVRQDVLLGGWQVAESVQEGVDVEDAVGSGQGDVAQPQLLQRQFPMSLGGYERVMARAQVVHCCLLGLAVSCSAGRGVRR